MVRATVSESKKRNKQTNTSHRSQSQSDQARLQTSQSACTWRPSIVGESDRFRVDGLSDFGDVAVRVLSEECYQIFLCGNVSGFVGLGQVLLLVGVSLDEVQVEGAGSVVLFPGDNFVAGVPREIVPASGERRIVEYMNRFTYTHTHARTHELTHARTPARTHAHTHTHTHTHIYIYIYIERERERERERQTDRQRDRERDRERDRDRQTERQTDRQTQRETET